MPKQNESVLNLRGVIVPVMRENVDFINTVSLLNNIEYCDERICVYLCLFL